MRFYSPLAMSWIFMASESPINVAVLSRLPDPKINTAAFAVLIGLALWFESPVIDLLSTSTTLTKDRRSYAAISKFSITLMFLASGVHALVALSPLYWLVTRQIVGVPQEVAEHARVGMIIMIPWSASIGWRRYLQGILIRFGQTRLVGLGTAVRISTISATASLLFFFSPLSGMEIAAIALVSAVFAEALFAHWATRGVIARHLHEPAEDAPEIDAKKLTHFHFPLTITTMVNLSTPLLISAALSHSPGPVLALASYQVAQTLLWLHRTAVFALPEVVITLYRDAASAWVLRRFSIGVGLTTSGLLLFCWLTGLDRLFFARLLGAQEDVVALAHIAFLAAAATPFLGALQSYVRGMLTAHHLTVARLYAVGVGVLALVVGLILGIVAQIPGVVTAGLALTLSMLVELLVLVAYWRKRTVESTL